MGKGKMIRLTKLDETEAYLSPGAIRAIWPRRVGDTMGSILDTRGGRQVVVAESPGAVAGMAARAGRTFTKLTPMTAEFDYVFVGDGFESVEDFGTMTLIWFDLANRISVEGTIEEVLGGID